VSWLGKILYRGRVRGLKEVERAAALMAAGRLDDAAEVLDRWKPTAYLEDVSVYHFVAGRLSMERGRLDEAEIHLMAARAVGLKTASLSLMLAILKARQCQMSEALRFLAEAGKSKDPGVLEQVDAVKHAIARVRDGSACRALRKQAEQFARDQLASTLAQGEKVRPLAAKLQQWLSGSRSSKTLKDSQADGASAVMGEILVQCCRGAWQLGLEVSDHKVSVRGVALSPWRLVDDFRQGDLASLTDVVDDPLKT
jgi:hypothetical protein